MENKSFELKDGGVLPFITSKQAVQQAQREIEEGRTGEQLALLSRHSKIRNALLGGFRFNNIYVIAGMSGVCKSYYLNMLYQDFLNKELNGKFKKPFKILHFGFEMAAFDEILRALQGKVGITYRDILSVDSILPDQSFEKVRAILKTMEDQEIYYVENTGNVNQIYNTIMDFKMKFPQHEIIVGIDHTLLTNYLNEKDEVALVSKLSTTFVDIRKKLKAMIFEVSQLNDKIESDDRILRASLHFPKKQDLHGSKAVFQCSDYTIVMHSPEKLGIESYGREGYETKGLIAWHLIKARKGNVGLIRLKDKLSEGTLEEWN